MHHWTLDETLGCYVIENLPLNCDGDGANGKQGGIACYVPVGSGLPSLDYLANAGSPGNWWGIYTQGGIPVKQTQGMPVPGAFISTTSYENKNYPDGSAIPQSNPDRYLDAVAIPYVVIPRAFQKSVPGIVLGCKCEVEYKDKIAPAMSGDIGPDFGEFSINLCKQFDPLATPKSTNITSGVTLRIWPGVPFDNAHPLQRA